MLRALAPGVHAPATHAPASAKGHAQNACCRYKCSTEKHVCNTHMVHGTHALQCRHKRCQESSRDVRWVIRACCTARREEHPTPLLLTIALDNIIISSIILITTIPSKAHHPKKDMPKGMLKAGTQVLMITPQPCALHSSVR